jgi:hypothetical protein
MRFCQSDGTQLVAIEEVIDPYKTMVARPEDIAAAIPPQFDKPLEVADAPFASPGPKEEEVLQIPETSDPMKTQFVSEAELRKEMESAAGPDEPVMEIPPAAATPNPPAFIDPDLNPVTVAPPEPEAPVFSSPEPEERPANLTTPPIPSPFGSAGSSASDVSPMVPQFKEPAREPDPEPEPKPEPEPIVHVAPATPFEPPVPMSPFAEQQAASPFDEPAVPQVSASTPQDQQMAQSDWTPPPAGGAGFQQPGAPAPAGQSSTLAIVSLVVGILSIFCCGWFIPGIVAIVLGFMARSKASKDPAHYGGGGLALGGILTGVFSLILGVIVVILYFLGFAASLMNGRY